MLAIGSFGTLRNRQPTRLARLEDFVRLAVYKMLELHVVLLAIWGQFEVVIDIMNQLLGSCRKRFTSAGSNQVKGMAVTLQHEDIRTIDFILVRNESFSSCMRFSPSDAYPILLSHPIWSRSRASFSY